MAAMKKGRQVLVMLHRTSQQWSNMNTIPILAQKSWSQHVQVVSLGVRNFDLRQYSSIVAPQTKDIPTTRDEINALQAQRHHQRPGPESLDTALHNLNLNVQRTGRVLEYDVSRIFNMIKVNGGCTPNQALLILRCCGSALVDVPMNERHKIALELWTFCESNGMSLDTSHYNAVLKVNIENEQQFVPAEFLARMEAKGMEPNRVTYQHLIAKYCQDGDTAGATTILEFMKEQNMSVNESVFHSLITGHCKSGDIEAAKGVMTIMGEAGLDTGNEAHMAFILGIVAGDQPWSAIKEHMTELNDKGIFFNDSDYFSLIVVLIRKGFKEGAVELSTALPKKSGFFQEMRNALPQMILAGEVDLPFSILSEFQGPHLNYETHTEATTRDHGLFILRAMVNADYPADKVVEMLEKIASNNTDTLTRYLSRCLENYIQLDKREQCLEFVEVAKTKHGSDFLRPGLYHGWIRAQCSRLADSTEDMLQFLLKLEGNGINVNVTNLSQDFLPHLVDKSENLGSGLVMIKKAADAQGIRLGWGKLSTAGVQYMLNKDTEEAFSAVASFLVAINVPSRPLAWYASLGRNYLITDDLHSLKTILFLSSNTYEKFKAKATTFDEINDTYLFRSLCHIHRQCHRFKPQEDPDLVLDIVLKELQQQKIGITSEVAAELTLLIQDVTVKDRVAMLEEYYKDSDNNWTNERTKKYLDHLKSGRVYQRLSVNSDFIPMDRDGRITDGDFPSDIKGLEKAFDIVSKKNRFNMKLSDKLATAYALDGRMVDCENVVEKTRATGCSFTLSPHLMDAMAKHKFKESSGDIGQVLEWLNEQLTEDGCRVFYTTYTDLALSLAKADRHEDVLTCLGAIQKSLIGVDQAIKFSNDLFKHYIDNVPDIAKTEDLVRTCRNLELDGLPSVSLQGVLVKHQAHNGDLEAALQTFERAVAEDKKMPAKKYLMKELILAEDMTKMQRLVDASIEVIGEEGSLYDLAFAFIELGKTPQARKLLLTPGLRYNHEKSKYICSRLHEAGALQGLEDFVKLSMPLFACDREYLFQRLVDAVQHDVEKIEEVWVLMQEESHVPSDNLMIKMAKAFMVHGRKVPFEIPESHRPSTPRQDPESHRPITPRNETSTSQNPKQRTSRQDHTERSPLHLALDSKDLVTAVEEFKKSSGQGPMMLRRILDLMNEQQNYGHGLDIVLRALELGILTPLEQRRNTIRQIVLSLDDNSVKKLEQKVTLEGRKALALDSAVVARSFKESNTDLLDSLENIDADKVGYVRFDMILPKLTSEEVADKAIEFGAKVKNAAFSRELLIAAILSDNKKAAQDVWSNQVKGTDDRVLPRRLPATIEGQTTLYKFGQDNGFDKHSLATTVNPIIEDHLNVNRSEEATLVIKDALKSWISIDMLSNQVLRFISVDGQDFSDEHKTVAKDVIAQRQADRRTRNQSN